MAGRRYLLYVWNDRTRTGFHLHVTPNERLFWVERVSHEKEDFLSCPILFLDTGLVVRHLPLHPGDKEPSVSERQMDCLMNAVSMALVDVGNKEAENGKE